MHSKNRVKAGSRHTFGLLRRGIALWENYSKKVMRLAYTRLHQELKCLESNFVEKMRKRESCKAMADNACIGHDSYRKQEELSIPDRMVDNRSFTLLMR